MIKSAPRLLHPQKSRLTPPVGSALLSAQQFFPSYWSCIYICIPLGIQPMQVSSVPVLLDVRAIDYKNVLSINNNLIIINVLLLTNV